MLMISKHGQMKVLISRFSLGVFAHVQFLIHQPKNVDVLTDKGIALNNIGNYTGAITYYDKTLGIDPKNVDVLST